MGAVAKRLIAIVLSTLLAVLLASCANVNLSLKINADGSADWGLKMLLADTAMSQAGADIWKNATKELEAQGCTVTDLKSEGYTGISAMRHFQRVEDMAESKTGLVNIFSGADPAFIIKTNKTFFATDYDIHATIDAAKIATLPTQAGTEGLGQVQLTMDVTLPAKASVYNATTVSGDGLTYTWVLNPDTANSIELSASVPNTGNMLVAGCGAVLVLIIVAVAVVICVKRRKATRVVQRRAAGRGR